MRTLALLFCFIGSSVLAQSNYGISERLFVSTLRTVKTNFGVSNSIRIGNEPPSKNTSPSLAEGRYFALLIGVSDYKNNTSDLKDLNRPLTDAKALAQALKAYSFPQNGIKVLENPTRGQIIDTFDSLSKSLRDDKNLLVFYAGHGIWDEQLEVGYWLPSDADLNKKSTWISNSEIKDYIGGIPSKHTLLITDACFGGSLLNTRNAEAFTDLSFAKLYKYTSRKVMTSGNLTTVPDNSFFFDLLLKRLSENQENYLPARMLFNEIYLGVVNNTFTIPQYGVIFGTGDEGGEFIFVKEEK